MSCTLSACRPSFSNCSAPRSTSSRPSKSDGSRPDSEATASRGSSEGRLNVSPSSSNSQRSPSASKRCARTALTLYLAIRAFPLARSGGLFFGGGTRGRVDRPLRERLGRAVDRRHRGEGDAELDRRRPPASGRMGDDSGRIRPFRRQGNGPLPAWGGGRRCSGNYAPLPMAKTCSTPPQTFDGSVTLATVLPASRVIGLVPKTIVRICCGSLPAALRYGVDSTIRLPNDGWAPPPPSVQSENPIVAVDLLPSV